VAVCDTNDDLFVAFRSWPLIRKYSPEGKLISENQFTIPSELIPDSQRKNYSLDFFAKYPDNAFIPPIITHSISINGRGTGYLLLNAHDFNMCVDFRGVQVAITQELLHVAQAGAATNRCVAQQ
jgi:hypothetical protein